MRILAASLVLVACSSADTGELATYARHGFEFRYPSGLTVTEPTVGGEPAGADRGQVSATTPDPEQAGESTAVGVAWQRVDSAAMLEADGAVERGVDGALAGAEEAGELTLTHRGELAVLNHGGGRLAYRTFTGRPTNSRTVFGVAGTLYCPRGERLFVLVAASSDWRSERGATRAFRRFFTPLRC